MMNELEKAYSILTKIKDINNKQEVNRVCLEAFNTSNYCLEAFCMYIKTSDLSFKDKVNKYENEYILIKNDNNNLVNIDKYLYFLYEYGQMLIKNGSINKAIKIYEHLLSLDINDTRKIYNYLIILYAYKEDNKIISFNEQYGKDNIEFYLPLAIYFYKQCDFDKCDYYIDLILSKDKNFFNSNNKILKNNAYLINSVNFTSYIKDYYD